ncbi:sulfotransferase family protein [uncultured Cyclobacterium sp.]|uniref:sulfotransferase-like domain-containing protein n=1 Tax=uncultured Cyclobacterium sp. TaxID=453820 RepID=UPI0030EEE550|tara:strand:+ start:64917 stop:65645 length:729 start_codon:yes stop_codon:yes gene_type:complete
MAKENNKKIFLWSGPRNISTALMYSFAQRSDTFVVDEPLYGHYLSHSSAKPFHPGAEEILSKMETDGKKVVEGMIGPQQKPVAFFKNMSHHLIQLDWQFMTAGANIILTRNPEEMLLSFSKVIGQPGMDDVGYAMQWKLMEYLQTMQLPFVVIDAKKVLLNPEGQLRKLCDFLSLPFKEDMLNWDKGPIPEDGVWAKYWYNNVHLSTGFQRYEKKEMVFPKQLLPLLRECQPIYDRLVKHAL